MAELAEIAAKIINTKFKNLFKKIKTNIWKTM